MSEAMKKHTTGGYVEVRFRIPVTKVVEAKQILASYGAIAEDSESIPWEEVYPDFNGSVALRGAWIKRDFDPKRIGSPGGGQPDPHLGNGAWQEAHRQRYGQEAGQGSQDQLPGFLMRSSGNSRLPNFKRPSRHSL
jgi:hypothetical protein